MIFGGLIYGTLLGFLTSIIADAKNEMNNVLTAIALTFNLTSGFFAQVKTMKQPLKFYSNFSGFRYIFQGLVLNEF